MTPEEMVEAMAKAKEESGDSLPSDAVASTSGEKEPETGSIIITDKAEIEAALADTIGPVVEEPVDEITKVRNRITEILKEFNNEISSIPLSHEYWILMNRYNALRNP